MKKKTKRVYVTPESKVYAMQTEQFICGSVTPHPKGSTTTQWDNDEESEGGTILIGDEGDVAPWSRQWKQVLEIQKKGEIKWR